MVDVIQYHRDIPSAGCRWSARTGSAEAVAEVGAVQHVVELGEQRQLPAGWQPDVFGHAGAGIINALPSALFTPTGLPSAPSNISEPSPLGLMARYLRVWPRRGGGKRWRHVDLPGQMEHAGDGDAVPLVERRRSPLPGRIDIATGRRRLSAVRWIHSAWCDRSCRPCRAPRPACS